MRQRLLSLRLPIIHAGILLTFALIPVWYRLPVRPAFLPPLYVSRFLLWLPLLFTVVAWLIGGLPGLWRLRGAQRWWALALLLLALWALSSTAWAFQRAAYPEVGGTAALQFAVAALFAVVCARAAPPPRRVAVVLMIGCALNAAITVAQVQNNGALGLTRIGEFPFNARADGISLLRAGDLVYVRPYGLMPHPNALAGTLMLGALAAGAFVLSERRWSWLGGTAVMALGAWALLLTFSRAAWIGAALGGALIAPFARPLLRRRTWISAALVVGVGALFILSYRPFLAARIGEGQESVELRSISDRLVFTDFALRSISERPVFGVGIGNFPWRASFYLAETTYDLRGDNVHHVLLSAWAELGTVGLLLLLLALISGGIALFQRLREKDAEAADHAARIGLAAIWIALLVVGWFDHYPWTMLHFQVAWWGLLGVAIRK